jgi:hypothetical protein
MFDESLLFLHAPLGHLLLCDPHLELTASRDSPIDREWDPILVELEATAINTVPSQPCSHLGKAFSPPGCMSYSGPSRSPSVHNPTMEFMQVEISTTASAERPSPSSSARQAQMPWPQPASMPRVPDSQFVNSTRGASPSSMVDGAIPGSSTSFVHMISSPMPPTSQMLQPPPRRHRRRRSPPASLPWRGRRLAAKARSGLPTVTATQNLLMRKLGVATDTHIESADFERYIDLFLDGLSE